MSSSDALPKSSSSGSVLLAAENVLEKLKVLDYDGGDDSDEAAPSLLSRTYFTEPAANASSQWAALLSVSAWLLGKAGNADFSVDSYDDPNTSANKLMLALKQLGMESDFPVSRLKQGYGEVVCSVLDFLADKALQRRGFRFEEPQYPETDGFEEALVDEDADLGGQESDIEDEAVESEEEDALYSETMRSAKPSASTGGEGSGEGKHAGNAAKGGGGDRDRDGGGGDGGGGGGGGGGGAGSDDADASGMLEGERSAEFQAAWRAEMERVAPRLRKALAPSGNEWRSHLAQTKRHDANIQQLLPACSQQLQQITSDLSEALERISSKETLLAGSFEHIAQEYKGVQQRLEAVTQQHEVSNEAVEKLSDELSTVTEALDELKENMDTRGNSMVDTSPLQKIRKALQTIKSEIKQMELRIGVLGHSLLQASLRTAQEQRKAKKPVRGAKSPTLDASPRSPSLDIF